MLARAFDDVVECAFFHNRDRCEVQELVRSGRYRTQVQAIDGLLHILPDDGELRPDKSKLPVNSCTYVVAYTILIP